MAVIIPINNTYTHTNYPINKKYVYLISSIAALGGILFGYDLVIISGAVPFFTDFFKLSDVEKGWAVGCLNLGAAVGALVSGKLSDILGRKKLLMFAALLFALTGMGTGWASNFNLFIAVRMLSGVAVGAAALVCPVYVSEIVPAKMRGKMVSYYQLSIVFGILLAYIANFLLLDTGINNWRWMFSSQALPAIVFFIGLFFVAESPRWLISKNKDNEAKLILERISGSQYAATEIKQIKESYAKKPSNSVKALFGKDVKHIVLIGIVIAICSQAVGQNSLFSYAPEIFKQAGMSQDTAFLQSIIIGIITCSFTFIAISSIDKVGRKKLLFYGSLLLGLDAVALAAAFYFNLPGIFVLVFLLAFIGIYSATIGPVTWVILSEMFPNRIRSSAMSLATLSLWITNFFTTALFPIMSGGLGLPITFLIHAGICLLYFLFIRVKIPETKGKSLEEIEKMLAH